MFSLPVRKRRTRPHICLYLQELERRALLALAPLPVTGMAYSTNWSGYTAETSLSNPASNAVTAVSGSWTVTGVTGNNNAYAAEWVGIDGYSSPTVEQVGTLQETFRSGAPTYYAWYEMYPNSLVEITSLTISPGNTISASVTYNGNGSFALKMTDNTTGKSFSTTQSLPSGSTAQRSSAEWIVEAPSSWFGVLPLANFGTVNFSEAQATFNNGITGPIDNNPSWQNTAIDMVSQSGTTTIATTSALIDSTTTPMTSSFNVAYTGSTGSYQLRGGRVQGGSNQTVNVIPVQPNFQAPAGIIPGVTVAPITGTAPMQVSSPGALPAPQAELYPHLIIDRSTHSN